MTTASVDEMYKALRTQLLGYVDPSGKTLDQAVSGRLWRIAAPDTATYPYGLIAIKSPQVVPDSDGLKYTADVEVLWFGRPRSTQPEIEALGVRTVQAMMTYRDTSDGILYFASATSESLPEFPAPADSNIVQVRVLGKLNYWPTFVTELSA